MTGDPVDRPALTDEQLAEWREMADSDSRYRYPTKGAVQEALGRAVAALTLPQTSASCPVCLNPTTRRASRRDLP